MTASLFKDGPHFKRLNLGHSLTAASLIELLVVLFIIGIMMGLLLPALQGARNRA